MSAKKEITITRWKNYTMELFEEFSQLVNEFKKEKIEYALCGGLAMAVYAQTFQYGH